MSQTIQTYLSDHPWVDQIVQLDAVDSTNTYAKQLAGVGAPHGTVVLANHQTGGRGRLGRQFSSPAGLGIYCSVILRYAVPPEKLLLLTPVMAEAARRAVVNATGLRPSIKWINDLVLEGRKLCGILTELGSGFVVVGIGINCHQQPLDFPPELREIATSLAQNLTGPVNRNVVAAELIRQVQLAADGFLDDPAHWMKAYGANCLTIGKDVQLIRGDEVRLAHADGLDEQGALLVTLPDGTKETVFSGEVSVRGLYGYL